MNNGKRWTRLLVEQKCLMEDEQMNFATNMLFVLDSPILYAPGTLQRMRRQGLIPRSSQSTINTRETTKKGEGREDNLGKTMPLLQGHILGFSYKIGTSYRPSQTRQGFRKDCDPSSPRAMLWGTTGQEGVGQFWVQESSSLTCGLQNNTE